MTILSKLDTRRVHMSHLGIHEWEILRKAFIWVAYSGGVQAWKGYDTNEKAGLETEN